MTDEEKQAPTSIFERSDEELIATAKQLIEVVQTMKEQAVSDPTKKPPTPQKLAEILHLTIDDTIMLYDFAFNDLGQFERAHIESTRIATIDDQGQIVR